jgi:hypothetical protein
MCGIAGGLTTGTDGCGCGTVTSDAPVPPTDGTCESAAATALWAGAGTTAPSWLSAPEAVPAACAPAGAVSASVKSTAVSAPDKPQSFRIR